MALRHWIEFTVFTVAIFLHRTFFNAIIKFGLQYKTISVRQMCRARLYSYRFTSKKFFFLVFDSLYLSHVHAICRVHTESEYAWVDFLHLLLSLLFIHCILRVFLRMSCKEDTRLVYHSGPAQGRPPRNRYSPNTSLKKNQQRSTIRD